MPGCFIPATRNRTPRSLELSAAVGAFVRQMVGYDSFLVTAQHVLSFGEAGWQIGCGVKCFAASMRLHTWTYGTLTAAPCAYCPVPCEPNIGSARTQQRTGGHQRRGLRGIDRAYISHVSDSSPGDLILFDKRLYLACLNGNDSYQWSTVYYPEPECICRKSSTEPSTQQRNALPAERRQPKSLLWGTQPPQAPSCS